MRRMSWLPLLAVFVAACAAGVNAGGDDDDQVSRADASRSSPDASHVVPDASQGVPDARPAPDATHIVPDAAPVSVDAGLFCNSTSECGSGDCCFYIEQPPGFCVPGTDIGDGICIPSGG